MDAREVLMKDRMRKVTEALVGGPPEAVESVEDSRCWIRQHAAASQQQTNTVRFLIKRIVLVGVSFLG